MKRIYIEITNKCNLNCKFCPKTSRKPRNMTIAEFETILIKTKHITKFIYLHIMGEPLFHTEFEEILKICDKHEMQLNLTTNGSLITEKLPVLCSSTALRKISLSIHSSSQNQNKSFDEMYLQNCLNASKTLANAGKICQLRLWNSDLSDNFSMISKISNEFGAEIKENLENHILSENIYLNIKNSFAWPSMKAEVLQESGYCLALKQQIGILADGSVVPCCLDSEGDIILGNIFKESIDEILLNERTVKMKKGFEARKLTENLCKRCGYSNESFSKKLKNKKTF